MSKNIKKAYTKHWYVNNLQVYTAAMNTQPRFQLDHSSPEYPVTNANISNIKTQKSCNFYN